ncbi:conserved hypothetical protein [Treponema pallidum subsp. pallidum str. Chicago]|nr:conserved hypothetical protein [Treponema pallidum subsp. pallidum str. Chicago]
MLDSGPFTMSRHEIFPLMPENVRTGTRAPDASTVCAFLQVPLAHIARPA